MIFFTHLFFGFIMAFGGLLAPGMLNMTAVKISIERGKRSGVIFSAGAASVVFIQAFIALFFANYLNNNPEIIEKLKIAGIIVFFLLSIFFFFQARKKFKDEGKQKKGNYFFTGAFMSLMNMLAIPFYLGISTLLGAEGKIILEQPYIMIFVVGSVIGAFSLFITYVSFAGIIIKRAQFIAQNINYILSILFLIIGIGAIINF
ncbi:MAG: LysE family transporter [Bacteroidia bacterium]|nr:LysE family transporter [Bacteroidia bacterium]